MCVMDNIISVIDVQRVVASGGYAWYGRCYRDGVHTCSRKCMHLHREQLCKKM